MWGAMQFKRAVVFNEITGARRQSVSFVAQFYRGEILKMFENCKVVSFCCLYTNVYNHNIPTYARGTYRGIWGDTFTPLPVCHCMSP